MNQHIEYIHAGCGGKVIHSIDMRYTPRTFKHCEKCGKQKYDEKEQITYIEETF